MTGTDPKRQVSRQEKRHRIRKMAGPALKIRVQGDGWVRHGRPVMVPDKLWHSEWWTQPDEDGVSHNKVPRRKSMRRFPDLPPIKSGQPTS